MTLYVQNPKDHQKLFKLIINSVKLQDMKSVVFLYANNELTKRFEGTIRFTIASKRIKYLGINLTKEVKDLW